MTRILKPFHPACPQFLLIALCFVCAGPPNTVSAVDDTAEQKAIQLNTAYLQRLKRQPGPGTTLDKVYAFQIDRGTLGTFLLELNAGAKAVAADGSDTMLVGLIEQRRGRFVAAKTAFEAAVIQRPKDPIAKRQLGQVLASLGKNSAAADTLEAALLLTTAPRDQSDIYQLLGRIYQRTLDPEQALNLWKRYESAFPGDAMVKEKIAGVLAQEGHDQAALQRYRALSAASRDPYKQTEFGTKVAELLLKLDQRDEAIQQFQKLLTQLKPDSWQADGIRDRIEQAFLKSDDHGGLVTYLKQWISQHPDDIHAMSRLARSLSATHDSAAARKWLQQAIAKSPSDAKLRESLIAELTNQKMFAEAALQYEQLAKIDAGNGQHLERWGRLVRRDSSVLEATRNAAATSIWTQLLQLAADDPVNVTHVAGLFRSAGMVEQAIPLYQQAIDLAPTAPQYVEYLGEYLHSLNRTDDALLKFGQMAAGERRTTENLSRLSQVLANFGYTEQALAAMTAAIELTPQFLDYVRLATLLREAKRYEECLQQLGLAEQNVGNDEERRQLQQERIQCYQAADTLPQQIAEMQQQLTAASLSDTTEQQWQFLGLLQQTAGRLRDAAKSLQQAVRLNPGSTESWTLAADIMEKAGLLADASEAHKQLAAMDRRTQVEHLKRVAELEQQLGRSAAALQAAKDVITAAPGNPEASRFYADMCFRLGQPEQAIEALRQAVRSNPGDREALQTLAAVLADEFRTEEATELYWRAFEKTEDLNARVAIVRSLAGLYLRTDQFPQLVTRLQSLASDSADHRDMLQCLSNAYQTAGNASAARQTIEALLQESPRDRSLLQEAVALAVETKDVAAAIRYQRQLVQESRSADETSKLASLLLDSGDFEAAAELWRNLPSTDGNAEQLLASMDQLLARNMDNAAADMAGQLLARDANNWQAMLRLAFIATKQNQSDTAIGYCERILAVSLPPGNSPMSEWIPKTPADLPPPLRVGDFGSMLVKELVKKDGVLSDGKGSVEFGPIPTPWPVTHYAEARCAALKLQRELHRRQGTDEPFLNELIERAARSSDENPQAAWDCFYASPSRQMAGLLQPVSTAEAQLVYLYNEVQRPQSEHTTIDARKLLTAYRTVASQHPEWLLPFRGVARVIHVLEASGDSAAAKQIRDSLQRDNTAPAELYAAWEMAMEESHVAALLQVAGRLIEIEDSSPAVAIRADTLNTLGWTFAQLASKQISENQWPAVEQLLSEFLTIKAATLSRFGRQRHFQTQEPVFVSTTSHRTFQNGRHTNSIRVTTLGPDEYLSVADINFFVNLELLAGEANWPRLLSTVQKFRNQATGDQAVVSELALAHLFVLHGDQNAAAVHLVRAAAAAPDNAGLRLTLTRYYQASGNDAEALALLDTINAVDQNVMQQKETLALQLATSTGNPVRARQAAERLFGLRLDTDTSIKLAARMRTLDLNELADAVLSRIHRSSGNGIETLESLMGQYQQQDNADIAAQIAQQILQETNTGSRRSAAAEAIRASAVKTLAELGQLDSQITRTEQQLQLDPESVDLLQSLMEFYKAAGRSDAAVAVAAKLAEVQPNSIDHLLRLATQYEKVRNFSGACTHYLEVLKKDPQRFTQNYYQYLRTFQNARRLPELADVLLTVDLRKLNNNYYVVGETIEYLFAAVSGNREARAADANQQKGLELLAAGWKAFPNERSYLLNNIRDPEIWCLPVMFDYAREGMIPATPQQAIARPWRGIAESPSFGANGEVVGTLTRVLRAMPDSAKLQLFASEIQTAVTQYPDWHGGRLILCVLQAKRGDQSTALEALNQLLVDPNIAYVPSQAAWLVSAELQKCGSEFLPSVTQMLQRSVQEKGFAVSGGYEKSVGRRLAELYGMQGQTRRAISVIRQAIAAADQITYTEPGRKSWQRLANLKSAGVDIAKLSMPLDAIGMLQELTLQLLVASEQYKNEGAAHRQFREAKQLQATLLQQISTPVLVEYLDRTPEPGDNELTAIDLLLTPPADGAKIGLRNSVVLSAVEAAAKGKETDSLRSTLANLLQQRQDDVSVAVAAFVFADAAADTELQDAAMQSLTGDSLKTERPAGVALWFVAKSLLQSNETYQLGMTLADRAEAVARLSDSTNWLLAILKERGELAIRAGDIAAAEQAWSRMLDVVAPENSNAADATSGAGTSAVREVRELLNTTSERTP